MINKITTYIILTIFFIVPIFVLAATGSGNPPGGTTNVTIGNPAAGAGNTLIDVLVTLLEDVVMPIAVIAVIVWIIWAGFSYLTAQGKPAEIQKAHQRLLWSLIGAGILLGAVGISKVVQSTINAIIVP